MFMLQNGVKRLRECVLMIIRFCPQQGAEGISEKHVFGTLGLFFCRIGYTQVIIFYSRLRIIRHRII